MRESLEAFILGIQESKVGILIDLFFTFFKIGLFTFGGGYAMISLIEDTCVAKKGWITHEEMMDVVVVAEATPGPIAINCATFVGFRQAGLLGAVTATLGIVVPSFSIILLIAAYFDSFLDIPLVAYAFKGIKIGVGLLIFRAALKMIRKMEKGLLSRGIMVASCGAMLLIDIFAWDLSSISLLLAAAVAGLAAFGIKGLVSRKGGAAK